VHPVLLKTRFLVLALSGLVAWVFPLRPANLGSSALAVRVE